jgi:hypothetical protein
MSIWLPAVSILNVAQYLKGASVLDQSGKIEKHFKYEFGRWVFVRDPKFTEMEDSLLLAELLVSNFNMQM